MTSINDINTMTIVLEGGAAIKGLPPYFSIGAFVVNAEFPETTFKEWAEVKKRAHMLLDGLLDCAEREILNYVK